MFKIIKRKLANYLYGVNIEDLIDKNNLNLKEVEKLHSQNKHLVISIESLEREIEDKNRQFQQRENTLLDENKSAQNQIDLLREEIAKMQVNIHLLETENATLSKQIENEKMQTSEQVKLLEDKVKNELETNQGLSEKLAKLGSDLEKSNKKIHELTNDAEIQQENENEQLEIVRSLKEQISRQQAEISNAQNLKNELLKLKQISTNGKSLINELTADLKAVREEINTMNHVQSHENESLQMVDGVVVHQNMNVGKRTKKEFENGSNQFQYEGKFLFETGLATQSDSREFPNVFYPKKDTPILKWHEIKTSTTIGVTEPLLVTALKRINEIVPGIVTLQNIALGIRNRDYSYLPDVALYWEKYNLFIDIEIDEPYDLVTRKPLHYQGSSDYLRNLYFISQGWVVIRLSEEQVATNVDNCVNYILSVLKQLTKDEAFFGLEIEPIIEKTPRWTYDQAKELEVQKHREHYLKIDFESIDTIDNINNLNYIDFVGIPPAGDILPMIDYSELESKLNSINSKYIRVSYSDFGDQRILENYEIDKQDFMDGVKGFDVVEEEERFVKFETITEIEGIDSPFKNSLYNRVDINDNTFSEILNEAIYNLNPIRIEYKDGSANITFRNISLIAYQGDSKEYLCDGLWQNYYESKSSMINALCLLRNAHRSFYTYRIQSIQVFDVKNLGMGHIISLRTALWHPLMKNDLYLCEHITQLADKYLNEKDIIFRGNYAHYLVLSGKVKDAIKIYEAHVGQQITEELNWEQVNLKDFEDLSAENESYKSKFDKIKKLLKW